MTKIFDSKLMPSSKKRKKKTRKISIKEQCHFCGKMTSKGVLIHGSDFACQECSKIYG